MAKQKANQNTTSDSPEAKSVIPEEKGGVEEGTAPMMEKQEEKSGKGEGVRILFRGSCPKLTPRGIGKLEYEIGIDLEKREAVVRVTRNESSGAFSIHWVSVSKIRKVVDALQGQPFRGLIFRDLYSQKSSNNHGFLAAILKAEGVVETFPKQPTLMRLDSWEPLLKRIEDLKKTEVSLTDHLAVAARKWAEKKASNMAKMRRSRDKKAGREEAVERSAM